MGFITGDVYQDALSPLLKGEGHSLIETFVICAAVFGKGGGAHEPTFGAVQLSLWVENGVVAKGRVIVPKGAHHEEMTYRIKCVTGGLTDHCVTVMIDTEKGDIKLYLDIPVGEDADPVHQMMKEMSYRRQALENVETSLARWLKSSS